DLTPNPLHTPKIWWSSRIPMQLQIKYILQIVSLGNGWLGERSLSLIQNLPQSSTSIALISLISSKAAYASSSLSFSSSKSSSIGSLGSAGVSSSATATFTASSAAAAAFL